MPCIASYFVYYQDSSAWVAETRPTSQWPLALDTHKSHQLMIRLITVKYLITMTQVKINLHMN